MELRPLSEGNRFQRAYARWAAPHYARMPADTREQAELLDRFLYSRRGLGVWLGLLGAVAVTAAGLLGAGLPVGLAVTAAAFVALGLPLMLLSAWLVPGKFSAAYLGRQLPLIALLALAGGVTGFLFARVGRPGSLDLGLLLADLWRGAALLVPATLAAAAAMLFLGWGVAQARRQMLERTVERERLARERDTAARHAAEARLKLLQAQIQPHFIFNTLAALQHWVDTGDARAPALLRTLTAFLRGSTELLGRDEVTLGAEFEIAGQYLRIMQARLGERLRIALRLDPACAGRALPPGLLLTLVENAVEHGAMPALAGTTVQVRAQVDGERVRLTVQDNGPGLAPGAVDGVGLANSRARLSQAFGTRATLRLDNAPAGGCIAMLEWPLETAAAGDAPPPPAPGGPAPALAPALPPADPPAGPPA